MIGTRTIDLKMATRTIWLRKRIKHHQRREKGYDTDYASTSKTHTDRIPLQSPFKGKILRKTNGIINRDHFYKELNKRTNWRTVELSDGKILQKFDIAIPKSNSTKIRHFKGNISFPYFPNSNVEVGQKHENSRRKSKPRKPQPKTRKQVDLGSSDNLTRTSVSGSSSKLALGDNPVGRRSRQPPHVVLLRMNLC